MNFYLKSVWWQYKRYWQLNDRESSLVGPVSDDTWQPLPSPNLTEISLSDSFLSFLLLLFILWLHLIHIFKLSGRISRSSPTYVFIFYLFRITNFTCHMPCVSPSPFLIKYFSTLLSFFCFEVGFKRDFGAAGIKWYLLSWSEQDEI